MTLAEIFIPSYTKKPSDVMVVIMADSGIKYLSKI